MSANNRQQIEKFKAAAKEAGAEMSDAEFKKVVGKLAKAPKPKNGPLKKAKEKPSGTQLRTRSGQNRQPPPQWRFGRVVMHRIEQERR